MRIEVIVPAKDAASVLEGCLASIVAQRLAPSRVHLSVAPSADGTKQLALAAAAADPRVVVHDNPAGDRASALNVALATIDSAVEAVAMVDAQSRLAPDYLERSAAVLSATGAAVVGGPMRPLGLTTIGRGIAQALSSRAGVGDSSFHFEGSPRDVESVYLGVYRRAVLAALGPYDAALLRTEDDDMNARIRAEGGRIYLDPAIRSSYVGRQRIGALFQQYMGYGYWKVALAAVRPSAIRLRHLVPTTLIAAFVLSAIVSFLVWWPTLALLIGAYLLSLILVGLLTGSGPVQERLAMSLALAAMHLGYGLGSWHAILTGKWRR